MTYVLEKPQKEVAEIMGVKLETLHSMLYRAKKWIRKHFEEQFDHLNKA
ncbi:sigma factor-like helix-turn-helix DNA-binding protein [[Clostridium] scindens]